MSAALRSDVCAVIVTYHPPRAAAQRVQRMLEQGIAVIVVDNGSRPDELRDLDALAQDSAVRLLRNTGNLGIAAALNRGVNAAIERGYRHALLLDQDSDLPPQAIDVLRACAADYPEPDTVAVVGARFEDPLQRLSAPVAPAPAAAAWEEVAAVITSGSLLSLAVFAKLGGFRDEFFIDYVDIDYCERARRNGYRILRTKELLIRHAVGEPREGRFLWLRKWTTNHSAERRYYIARNDTVMLRESGNYSRGGWLLKSASRRLQMCKRVVLYEDDKLRKVTATLQGFWHGVRRRMGPRPH